MYKTYKLFWVTFLFLNSLPCLKAQDSLITATARETALFIQQMDGRFSGAGWDSLVADGRRSEYVLLGEEHFLAEIPLFTSVYASTVGFQHFVTETDPFSLKSLEKAILSNTTKTYDSILKNYGHSLSFFALKPEIEMLKAMTKRGTKLYGIEQVLMNADKWMAEELKQVTKSSEAASVYTRISKQSQEMFDAFAKNPNATSMYMLAPGFEEDLKALEAMKLSGVEQERISALRMSREIYLNQDHALRIKLMKHQLMKIYPEWGNGKTLFKFGAVHMPRGESLLKIYDIGNLVHNLAESRFQKSLHILVLGIEGTQGGPFKFIPPHPYNAKEGLLAALKPIFDAVSGDSWHCFALKAIQQQLKKAGQSPKDDLMRRILEGYDYLVVIPKVTAAGFEQQIP